MDSEELRRAAATCVAQADALVGHPYNVSCSMCDRGAELSRQTWSVVIACSSCNKPVNFYRALEAGGWRKSAMACPHCEKPLSIRGAARAGEEAVLDTVSSPCSQVLLDQIPTAAPDVPEVLLDWPTTQIGADRQMYQASALGKHGLVGVADFFSQRNLTALAALRAAVEAVDDPQLRAKLMFAFTAILARASKRYQWSRDRPLNAANQTYYIAPVFYEWNVFDLFTRKVDAVARSDEYIRSERSARRVANELDVSYEVRSAELLPLADETVDYVFTDPPFGSNLFYSDMNLFQEAWLRKFTDHAREAVVDRSGSGPSRRTAGRYEELLAAAFKECWRVLKPKGWMSVVFSNSSGEIWALLQRSLGGAGFVIEADGVTLLDKGQRSVKGLSSGTEGVVTADLIISVQKRDHVAQAKVEPTKHDIDALVGKILSEGSFATPSHVYLEVVRESLHRHFDMAALDYSAVLAALRARGLTIHPASGKLDAAPADGTQLEAWET